MFKMVNGKRMSLSEETNGLTQFETNQKLNILVADDARDILQLLNFHLSRAGFIVMSTDNGKTALEIARREDINIAILDWMMPEFSGVEICKILREEKPHVYVIILTALNSEDQRVAGLEAGADDYITKPFSGRELIVRIKNAVRRQFPSPVTPEQTAPTAANPKSETGLRIDPERWQVWKEGEEIELTRLEFELLKFLFSNPNIVFSRDQLLNQVWNYGYVGDDRVVDVHMARLRKKLENDPAHPRYIQTIRGVGYKYSP
jgi:DNA-binding response OmpR family regulator